MSFTEEETEYLKHYVCLMSTDEGKGQRMREIIDLAQNDVEKLEWQKKVSAKYYRWALDQYTEEEKIDQQIYNPYNEWHEATQVLKQFQLNDTAE